MGNTKTDTRTETVTPEAVAASGIISQYAANQLAQRGIVFVLDQRVADEYGKAVRAEAAMVAKITRDAAAEHQARRDREQAEGEARAATRIARENAAKRAGREAVAASSGLRIV